MDIQEAKQLACELLEEHGLLDEGWCFEYDTAKRRFGVCRYRSKTIGLSKHLVALNDVVKVKDVILHEIAHALVGSGHGHDAVWIAKALEIGCDGKRCYGDETVTPKGNYSAICCDCKDVYTRFKRPRGDSWCRCQRGRLQQSTKLIWIVEK